LILGPKASIRFCQFWKRFFFAGFVNFAEGLISVLMPSTKALNASYCRLFFFLQLQQMLAQLLANITVFY